MYENNGNSHSDKVRSAALFLLKAKEVERINQCSLNQLVSDITLLVQETLDVVEDRAISILPEESGKLAYCYRKFSMIQSFVNLSCH